MKTNQLPTIAFFLLICFNYLVAQDPGTIQYTIEDQSVLAQKVIDELRASDNFEISNVQLTGVFGNTQSIGSFSNGETALGIENGLILMNGSVNEFFGGNTTTAMGSNLGIPGDELINMMGAVYGSGSIPSFDASSIEFDFVPTTNSVSLKYVFASEEYCDFVGTSFVDQMGIFLSGPNIDGPFTMIGQPAINIATFQSQLGEETPVGINTINNAINTSLYIDNNTVATISGGGSCSVIDASLNQFTSMSQFDGWTVPLSASYDGLMIGQTYHMKIVVADGADKIFGSAIFLENGSLIAGQDLIVDAYAGMDQFLTCATNQVELGADSTSTGVDIEYEWTSAMGAVISDSDQQFITVTEPDQYYLKVTNTLSGQMAFDTVIVALDIEIPSVSVADPDILSCANPTVILMPSVGSAGQFSYEWSGPSGFITTEVNPEVNFAGNYSLQVTDMANGCTEFVDVNVFEDSNGPDVSIALPPFLNPGETIQLNGSSSYSNVTYEWNLDGVVFSNTPSPIINAEGVYCLTVTNPGNGCTATGCIEVIANAAIIADAGADQVITCIDQEVTIGGPNTSTGSDFMYTWTTPNGMTISNQFFPSIDEEGIYILTVTNTTTGQSAMDDVLVTDIRTSVLVTLNSSDVLDCQDTFVTIFSANTNSGVGTAYAWSTTDGNIVSTPASQDVEVDEPGTYSLVVTNTENGCTAEANIEVFADTNLPEVNIATPDLLSPINPMIILDASASSAGFAISYVWTSANGNVFSNELSPSVNTAGTYCLTVINNENGCSSTSCVDVLNDNSVIADAGPEQTLTCIVQSVTIGGQNSSIGTDITYAWADQNGSFVSSELFTEVSIPGIYTLTVVNGQTGESNSSSVTVIADYEVPQVNAVANGILDCNNSTVLLIAEVVNPASKAYQWFDTSGVEISTEAEVAVSEPGIYTVVVTDTENGCSEASTVDVDQDGVAPNVSIVPPPLLNPGALIQLLGSSSSSNVTFEWTASDGTVLANTPNLVVSVVGTYCLKVVGANGCESSACVEVIANAAIIADAGPDQILTCATTSVFSLGGPNTTMGPDITYEWIDALGNTIATTPTITVTQAGSYTLIVTDTATGDQATDEVAFLEDIVTPEFTIATPSSINCIANSVLIDATVTGDPDLFSYAWSTFGGNIVSDPTLEDITVDARGDYILEVTNIFNQCNNSQTVFVDEDISIPSVAVFVPGFLECGIDSIVLIGEASGQEQFVYAWTTSGGNIISDPTLLEITVDAPGAYTLEVINTENGCSGSDIVFVDSPDDLITAITNSIACFGESVVLDPTTFIEIDSSCAYNWQEQEGLSVDPDSSIIATVDLSGEYTLIKTDTTTGCEQIFRFNATIGSEISADAGPDQTLTCDITSVLIGGQNSTTGANFSYSWIGSNGSFLGNEPTLLVDSPGLYELLITDLNTGCQATDQVAVSTTNTLELEVIVMNISCFGLQDWSVEIIPSGGTPGYVTDTNIPIVNLQPGTYEVSLTDAAGCSVVESIEITEPDELIVTVLPNADGITAEIMGGVSPYTYDWSDGSDSMTLENPVIGEIYTLIIQDANGCTAETQFLFDPNAVGQTLAQELQCYPNPASDLITIELEGISSTLKQLEIVDLQGRSMTFESLFANQNTMNISVIDFTSGTYFISAIIDDKLYYQKLVILK